MSDNQAGPPARLDPGLAPAMLGCLGFILVLPGLCLLAQESSGLLVVGVGVAFIVLAIWLATRRQPT